MPRRNDSFPKMIRCRQRLYHAPLGHQQLPDTVRQAVIDSELASMIRPETTIALAAGSRGIDSYAIVFRELVATLKELGAAPFVFPAMGSHGGATAHGQRAVLESLGITESYVGCPIRSSMEVITLGTTASGLPVYLDKIASEADMIVPVNRIKPHTNFHGEFESGLCKMLAIGAGKHAQAIAIHSYGVKGLTEYMPEVVDTVLARAPVAAGIALIEDAGHRLSRIIGIPGRSIRSREPQLLGEVRAVTPSLPLDNLDLLIIERIGKEISGTGIDTNVVGRCRLLDYAAFDRPVIRCVVALDLTDDSHGNGIGMGIADLITQRLAAKVDPRITAINCITGLSPQLAAQPIALDTDREAIATAVDYLCAHVKLEELSVIRILDTLSLETIQVSEALFDALRNRDDLTFDGGVREMEFSHDGRLM